MAKIIDLGDKVRCKVDGFEGIATSRVEYLNGCVQYGVRPNVDKDGKRVDVSYIDIEELEVVEPEKNKASKEPNGGYMSDHPKF